MKYFKSTCAGLLLVLCSVSSGAHATLITNGTLEADLDTGVITDNLTRRLYTGFNVLDSTFENIVAAIGPGGMYDGWAFATSKESDEFLDGGQFLTVQRSDGLSPDDYHISASLEFHGFVYYVIDTFNDGQFQASSSLRLSNDLIDGFGGTDANPNYVLLYKDGIPVAEPATLAIFALGLMGLGLRRFKKKS